MGELIDEIREQRSLFGVNTDEDTDMQLEELRPTKSLFDPQPEQQEGEIQGSEISNDTTAEKQSRFWRRQFQVEPTRRQKQYDWLFGVIMPVVCIFFDPIFFNFWGELDGGILGAYRPFVYAGSFVSLVLMMTWLLWRDKLGGFAALLAGLFFAASVVSFAVGLVLFPFSVLGIFFYLVGLLGFTPLITSVIFLRNGVRALRVAKTGLARKTLLYTSILGSLWGLATPLAIQAEVTRSLDLIAGGTPETVRAEGLKLRLFGPLVNAYRLKEIYWDVPKESPKAVEIERLYFQLTGKSLKRN